MVFRSANKSIDPVQVPTHRVIFLGASNVALSFSTLVATARATWGAPVEIMAAMGHGRSYGRDTTVLGRKISGIFPCALWQDLQTRPAMPTAALVTDIGNDFLHGVSPEQLFGWVVGCVERLVDAGSTVVITQLPTESIERLGEARFRFFRRMFFPRSRLTLSAAKRIAREFNERLATLGESQKISVIPASGAWYGFDPIHLRRREKPRVWPLVLSPWHGGEEPVVITRPSLWAGAYLASLAPWERSIIGIRRRAKQPSGRLSDGSTISLY